MELADSRLGDGNANGEKRMIRKPGTVKPAFPVCRLQYVLSEPAPKAVGGQGESGKRGSQYTRPGFLLGSVPAQIPADTK